MTWYNTASFWHLWPSPLPQAPATVKRPRACCPPYEAPATMSAPMSACHNCKGFHPGGLAGTFWGGKRVAGEAGEDHPWCPWRETDNPPIMMYQTFTSRSRRDAPLSPAHLSPQIGPYKCHPWGKTGGAGRLLRGIPVQRAPPGRRGSSPPSGLACCPPSARYILTVEWPMVTPFAWHAKMVTREGSEGMTGWTR